MNGLKIDDVAQQTGLTKRSIRYYEQIGILSPPERSSGGVRLYSQDDVEFLKWAIDAKEVLGFSLQELKRFVKLSNMFESYRVNYKQAKDPTIQKQKVKEGLVLLNEQLFLVEKKIQKILTVQKELVDLREKVTNILLELEN